MNKFNLLLLLLWLPFAALAQTPAEPALVKKENKALDSVEEFHVLRSDGTIKHGPYSIKGRAWSAKGSYTMGRMSGTWTFYDFKGQPDHTYNFDNSTITYLQPDTGSFDIPVYTGEQFVTTKVDSKPLFFGGNPRMYGWIGQNARFPAVAQRNNQSGTVVICAVVTEDGELVSEQVTTSVTPLLDAEALRVVQLLPDDWTPAVVGGKSVASIVYIPVRFVIANGRK
ncbi:energy transducer TonB [Pontibacter akesuensis]|uniref:TonB family C-terminal domain-containing protein n=1 Tax=Pontibacter akesuensis TaxID=388950 RepID=A0A1I7JKZ3_9BACT|nr:energy transducer TonB [Pontibacter akesuensis]GHA69250.1 hypothetical protein GCM10007389_22920 [Pontibacter akesuensis]SFU85808.1 TonB family C-terminal domain-containing protein [Pontibacter akesuensis]